MESALVEMKKIIKNFGLRGAESPIEEKLLSCLRRFGVHAFPQKRIGKHRVDIFIKSQFKKIVVECDGANFHTDKTKDQKRDAELRAMGYLVLRFTGSQINRSVEGCAARVIENISEIYETKNFQDYLERKLKQAQEK